MKDVKEMKMDMTTKVKAAIKKFKGKDRFRTEFDNAGIVSLDSHSTKLFYLFPTMNVRLKMISIQSILAAGKHPVKQLQTMYDAEGPDGFTLNIHSLNHGSKTLPSALELFRIATNRGTEKCLNVFKNQEELEQDLAIIDKIDTETFCRKTAARNKKANNERMAAEKAAKEAMAKDTAEATTLLTEEL
jgi:hypothetical protein